MSVVIETSLGCLEVDLHSQLAPKACFNFIKLAKLGRYDLCEILQLKSNAVLRIGDPTNKGSGGESIFHLIDPAKPVFFEDEISSRLKHEGWGVLSMANTGPNTNAAQFMITLGNRLARLDGCHTIFGQVNLQDKASLRTLMVINSLPIDKKTESPIQQCIIKQISILLDPYPDPPELTVMLSQHKKKVIDTKSMLNLIISLDDQTMFQKYEHIKALHTERQKAEDLRQLPPGHTVFVCQLNPATNSDDLKTIFEKYGRVVGVYMPRDYLSGLTLCYAFVEYASQAERDRAYNEGSRLIIDDREIIVNLASRTNPRLLASLKQESQSSHPERNRKASEHNFDLHNTANGGLFKENLHHVSELHQYTESTAESQRYDHPIRSSCHESDRKRGNSRLRDSQRDGHRESYKDRGSHGDSYRNRDSPRDRDSHGDSYRNRESYRDKDSCRDRDWERSFHYRR